jgi:hypothetical protein
MQSSLPTHAPLDIYMALRLGRDWSIHIKLSIDGILSNTVLLLCVLFLFGCTSPAIKQQIVNLIHEQKLPSFEIFKMASHKVGRHLFKHLHLVMVPIEQVHIENGS